MKKLKIRKTWFSALKMMGFLGVMSLSSCMDPNYFPQVMPSAPAPNGNGQQFKSDLEKAIINADRIVILQHSHTSDFARIISNPSKAPQYSYGSRILSSAAKASFLNRVRNLSAYNRMGVSNQLFAPHHTIKFYSNGSLRSTMSVCIPCGDLRWNGSGNVPPQDIMRAITPTIANAGFQTRRDWDAIAKMEHKNRAGGYSGSGNYGSNSSPSNYRPSVPSTKPSAPVLPTPSNPIAPTPPKPSVPTAKAVPGKSGMVFNPFTQNQVDVNGIPSGTKVRDPHDKNPKHIFRVP